MTPGGLTGRRGALASALLGHSECMLELRRELITVARSAAPTVLLLGATGTGKDVAARILHGESARAANPFVAINCTAVPGALLEDMFFGHDAGAFTDAKRARAGLLEEAQGGTLFLDEIGDLDLALQAKLLRVLDERRVRRLGATGDRDFDVRIVAATHRDLGEAVDAGRFRQDLFYRLDVVSLTLPALEERVDDVLLLAEHFLTLAVTRYGRAVRGFDDESRVALRAARWPGNVRQLAHAIERAVLLGRSESITARDLRLVSPSARNSPPLAALVPAAQLHSESRRPSPSGVAASDASPGPGPDLRDVEMLALASALERADGSLSEAARMLGVTRDTVRQRIRRYGLRIRARVEFPPRVTSG